jgi:putative ABC transport system permease protein
MKTTRQAHPDKKRSLTYSLVWSLAWRNLEQNRSRTVLAILSVALGVAMTVGASVVSSAIINAFNQAGDAMSFSKGVIDQLGTILTSAGVAITCAAGLVIFNAFAISVTQRRSQIGTLRAVGMVRRQVIGMVMVEALLIGVIGTLLGLIFGPLLGSFTIMLTKLFLSDWVFVFTAGNAPFSTYLIASVGGILVTLIAVIFPAWRATKISPLAALKIESASPTADIRFRSAIIGVLTASILLAYLWVSPPGEIVQPPWDLRIVAFFGLIWLACIAVMAPALIYGVGNLARRMTSRLWPAVGRIVADNLLRARGRVMATVLTLAAVLTMIISMSGFLSFALNELMIPRIKGFLGSKLWLVTPFDVMKGMSAFNELETIEIPPEFFADFREIFAGRAQVVEISYVIVPELSFLGENYFSMLYSSEGVQVMGELLFSFTEGDWETARAILDQGCGILTSPAVVSKNHSSLYETVTVTGANGPVECTIAGIGSSVVGSTIISSAAGDAFDAGTPMASAIRTLPGIDHENFKSELLAFVTRYPGLVATRASEVFEVQVEILDMLPNMLSTVLLLAVIAAILGVVNTMVINIVERQWELGLLRVVGATRRQLIAIVMGEAALMGVTGSLLGLSGGAGITIISAVVYGGNAWGYPDLDLWWAAADALRPALLNGLVGLITAPLVSAGAAWGAFGVAIPKYGGDRGKGAVKYVCMDPASRDNSGRR